MKMRPPCLSLGETLTAVWGDRIGLKRAIIIGTVLAGGGYMLLPLLDAGLPLALAGLFLIFMSFEFSMVCSISLSTEAVPAFRATMMAAFFGVSGIGRLIGALIGGPVWLAGGMTAVGAISALASAVALLSLLWGFGWKAGRG